MPIYGHVHLAIRLPHITIPYMIWLRFSQCNYAQIWSVLSNFNVSLWHQVQTYQLSLYMGTNEACPNMGILYSYDISNLHIWAQKGQGYGHKWGMPKYGHTVYWWHQQSPYMGTQGTRTDSDPVVLSHRSSRYAHIQYGYLVNDASATRTTGPWTRPCFGCMPDWSVKTSRPELITSVKTDCVCHAP